MVKNALFGTIFFLFLITASWGELNISASVKYNLAFIDAHVEGDTRKDFGLQGMGFQLATYFGGRFLLYTSLSYSRIMAVRIDREKVDEDQWDPRFVMESFLGPAYRFDIGNKSDLMLGIGYHFMWNYLGADVDVVADDLDFGAQHGVGFIALYQYNFSRHLSLSSSVNTAYDFTNRFIDMMDIDEFYGCFSFGLCAGLVLRFH
jgi:hypothetical protein